MKLELKNPENAPQPAGKYSNLAVVPEGSKLLFIAGQIGNLKSGEILKGLEAQYDQALRNINSIIESEGGTKENLAKMNRGGRIGEVNYLLPMAACTIYHTISISVSTHLTILIMHMLFFITRDK